MRRVQAVLDFITKPGTVVVLIVLTLLSSLAGVLVPQLGDQDAALFREWARTSPFTYAIVDLLQLNRVFTSLWFLALVGVILLSLGQTIVTLARRNLAVGQPRHSGIPGAGPVPVPLKRRGYRPAGMVREEREGEQREVVLFRKNTIGRWGSVVFHGGLFLVILSAFLTASFQKRGYVQVIEGEIFSGRHEDFLGKQNGPFVGRFDTGFGTHLRGFRHEYWERGDIRELTSSVGIEKEGSVRAVQEIAVNSPGGIDGVRIYQTLKYGYALTFILHKANGDTVLTQFLLDRPDTPEQPATGTLDIPMSEYVMEVKFFPDGSRRSFRLSDPALHVEIFRKGAVFAQGSLSPLSPMVLGADRLSVADVRLWSGLRFVENVGEPVAYGGFFLALAGMVILYLLPPKEVRIVRRGDVFLAVQGTTKRYQAAFKEELACIEKELGVRING